jgi:proteic killer suppression protein
MILSFKSADTEALASGRRAKRFASVESSARRKLRQLQIARQLQDLRVPPGNRLEALRGDRAGQYSIRVNAPRTWRLWTTINGEKICESSNP